MAAHKRKRSVSELCASPSSVSSFDSPPRVNSSITNPFTIMASAPIHLHSRTMKRFRDNRPSAEMIHREFLSYMSFEASLLIRFQNELLICCTPRRTRVNTRKFHRNICKRKHKLQDPSQRSNPFIDSGIFLLRHRRRLLLSTKPNWLLQTATTVVLA